MANEDIMQSVNNNVGEYYNNHLTAITSIAGVKEAVLAEAKEFVGKCVLDAGCGMGELCYNAKVRGAEQVIGIDISERAIRLNIEKYKNSGITFLQASVENIPLEAEVVDIIFCTEVLEHTIDYRKALKEFYRILKKGGRCYISIPNYFNVMFLKKRKEDKRLKKINNRDLDLGWSPFGPQPIERYYNPYKLKKVMLNIGFNDVGIRSTNYQIPLENTYIWQLLSNQMFIGKYFKKLEKRRDVFDASVAKWLSYVPLIRFMGYKLYIFCKK